MSKALRRITGSLATSKSTVIFLNQLRSKIGTIFGSPEVTSGGNALKFYSSVRIDTRRKEILPNNTGVRTKVKVVKNKIAPPFQTVLIDILFGIGIDTMGCLIDVSLTKNVLKQSGSWYSWNNINIAQGRQNVLDYLKENKDIAEKIQMEVKMAII